MAVEQAQFPFVGPLDQGKSSKLLPIPRVSSSVNLERSAGEEDALVKRPGTESLAGSGTAPAVFSDVATVGDELLCFLDGEVHAYTEASDSLAFVDDMPICGLKSTEPVASYSSAQVIASAVSSGPNYTLAAWVSYYVINGIDVYNVNVSVFDKQTGSKTSASTQVPTSLNILNDFGRAARGIIAVYDFSSSSHVVMWPGNAASGLNLYRLEISDTVVPAQVWSEPSVEETGILDLEKGTVLSYNTYLSSFVFAVYKDDYTILCRNETNSSEEIIAAAAGEANGIRGLAVASDASSASGFTVYEHINDSVTASSSVLRKHRVSNNGTFLGTDSLAHVSLQGELRGALSYINNVAFYSFYRSDGASLIFRDENVSGSGVSLLSTSPFHEIEVVSAPAFGLTAVSASPYSQSTKSTVLFVGIHRRDQASSVVGLFSFEPGVGIGPPNLECHLRQGRAPFGDVVGSGRIVSEFGSSELLFPLISVSRYSEPSLSEDLVDSSGTVAKTELSLARFTQTGTRTRSFAELNGVLYIAGGTVQQYDGNRVTELGFVSYSPALPNDLSVASSGTVENGDYLVGKLYEWTDAKGLRHQSAVAIDNVSVNAAVDGTSNILVNVSPPRLSRKDIERHRFQRDGQAVRGVLYRSLAGGSTLYRVEGIDDDPEDGNIYLNMANSPSGGPSTSYSDAEYSLDSREILYTSQAGAGELQNLSPPASNIIVAHQDRLWGVTAEDPTVVWYTKYAYPGTGIAWNPSLIVTFQDPVTALVSQDGNLVAFTENGIYTVRDRDADNTGGGTTYDPPVLLSGERGCTNQRSVVAAPGYTFFQSGGSIWALPRGGSEPVDIGESIAETLAEFPVIASAVHFPEKKQVRFCVTGPDTSAQTFLSSDRYKEGRVVVYDYDVKQWFVWDYGSRRMVGIAKHKGQMVVMFYELLSDNIQLWREDDGFDDPDGYVGWSLETGDVRMGGMTGHQQIRHVSLLASRQDTADLTIEVSPDGGVTWPEYVKWGFISEEKDINRQYAVAESVSSTHRFRLTETQNGSTVDTAGIQVFGMVLEGRPLRGLSRIGNSSRG